MRTALFMVFPFNGQMGWIRDRDCTFMYSLRFLNGVTVHRCRDSPLPIWAPRWFTHITFGQTQSLAHASVGRHRIQHTARPFAGGIQQHASVGSETGGFILTTRRYQGALVGRPVEYRDTIHVSAALHHCELDAFGLHHARTGVVLARKRRARTLAA